MILLSHERRHAVETLLGRLAGVESIRVETTEGGEIETIRVVSTGEFPPEQLARLIESALLAAADLEVDPSRILVAAPASADDSRNGEAVRLVPARGERRVRLNQVTFQQDRFKVTACVELGWEGQAVLGSSQDADTAKGRMTAAAQATIDALERLLHRRGAFFLEGLETQQAFERNIAVASLRVISPVRRADLVGCATIEEDPNYAAAQAVLDAVNRSFLRLLVEPGTPIQSIGSQRSPSIRGEARERYALS